MPRSLRGEATREQILRAAAEAFDRRGYLGVNLNEVVRELGLTKGALYYFFPSKESLADEIVRRHFDAWEPLTGQALQEHDDLLDALIDVSYRVARTYQTNCFARAGTRLSSERNLIGTELPEAFVGWLERITQLLEAAKAKGQLRPDVDAAAAANVMVSYFYGAQALSEHFSGRQDLPKRLEQFWEMIEPSLRPNSNRGGMPHPEETFMNPTEDLVRKGFDAFARGDLAAVRAMVSPEAVWHLAGLSTLAGTFVGVDAILGHLRRVFEFTGGTLRQELHDVVAGDRHVVALVRQHAHRGEEILDVNEAVVIHVADHVVTEAWVIPEDQYAYDRFFS
ncbi:MAG: ScbR family autoregulator-binding transcription factor [Actinomycetota bacterium]